MRSPLTKPAEPGRQQISFALESIGCVEWKNIALLKTWLQRSLLSFFLAFKLTTKTREPRWHQHVAFSHKRKNYQWLVLTEYIGRTCWPRLTLRAWRSAFLWSELVKYIWERNLQLSPRKRIKPAKTCLDVDATSGAGDKWKQTANEAERRDPFHSRREMDTASKSATSQLTSLHPSPTLTCYGENEQLGIWEVYCTF